MNGEDVYDVAKKAEDWEVGECPLCLLPYTRCDCPIDDDRCLDCLALLTKCRCHEMAQP